MRIIAGRWRSRRIASPGRTHTRPMPDRIREALFDILSSRFHCPGALPPVEVADLFAGSGSLGLEAVSRGASACDFVERRKQALDVLRDNIRRLGADDACRVIPANAWTACLTTPRPARAFAVVFVDPPYRDARDPTPTGRVGRLLADLGRAGWADHRTIIALHHQARIVFEPGPRAWWHVMDRRLYGSAAVTLVTGSAAADNGAPTSATPDGRNARP